MLERKTENSGLYDSLEKFLDYPKYREDVIKKRSQELKKLGIELVSFVSKGYRGVVLKGLNRKGNSVAVKVKRADAEKDVVLKEVGILRYLERFFRSKNLPLVVPEVYGVSERGEFFVMEFIEGVPLVSLSGDELLKAVKMSLKACYYLDLSGVYHSEIKGGKHLLFTGNSVKVIDFESAKFTDSPRNFLQFVGYHLIGKNLLPLEKEKLLEITSMFKRNPERAFRLTMKLLEAF